MAGIAAAATGNGVGIAGVAPDAHLMPIKVLFKECPTCQASGNAVDVEAGIRWAADRGADVINLSLGSTSSAVFGPDFEAAVRYAWDRGAIPVVAAGNQFVLTADFGDAPAVVVSATDRRDAAPGYSNGVGSSRWAIAAPGGDAGDTAESCSQAGSPVGILSTYWAPDDGTAAYACLSGTSMAAPHVSGALAVLRGAGLSPEEAVTTLLATARDIGAPGPDDVFGAGLVDLAAAAERLSTTPPESTSSVPPPTTPGVSEATTAPPTVTSQPSATAVEPPGEVVPPPTGPPVAETSSAQPFSTSTTDPPPAPLVALAIAAIGATAWATFLVRRRML